ncbi:MAG TPA: exodeoxyribonuclease III [Bacillota bacterium]|nr:exodeoxyribonuclease III [Bacillota bacterium]
MPKMKLSSWNVNGIRASVKKDQGILSYIRDGVPDVLGVQEVKADLSQIPSMLLEMPGYRTYFNTGEVKGYSGVGLLCRQEPIEVIDSIGVPEFDREGRFIAADFGGFVMANVYFPNGGQWPEPWPLDLEWPKGLDWEGWMAYKGWPGWLDRLRYKMAFYEKFMQWAIGLTASGRHLVVCGDVNTAHKEIDLARPKNNERTTGFLPGERDWITRFLGAGFVDTFRAFNQEGDNYTWWDLKTRARDRNVGWRLDYFFVDAPFMGKVKGAAIEKEVLGSDHCPVSITVET